MREENMKNSKGFSLMEVLISMSIFSIVAASTVPAFLNQLDHNTQMELRAQAYAAAQQVLDDYRVLEVSTIPDSGSASPVTVNVAGRNFEATTSFCDQAALCSLTTRHLTVAVQYQGEELYEVQTVYTQLR